MQHHYGERFHLVDDLFLQTLLTELRQQQTKQPQINRLVELLYNGLIEYLHWFLKPDNVRQDHIFAARKTNSDDVVTGTNLGSFKIGGSINDSFVIFPDPMGATGGTIISAIDHYNQEVVGPVKAYIALHLIVTPEYLKKVLSLNSPLHVFALRVDRGLSEKHILSSPLGLYWDKEKGLNDKQYIIPGAGGLGELLNNSFV